jgi:hypothetical protein
MKKLLQQLDRIAKANNDEFKYSAELRYNKKLDSVIIEFMASERADQHEFVSGMGESFDEIAESISEELLKEACDYWSYKYVD